MKTPKFSNPLKRSVDQKRAADGKFTAGSGGLSNLKKFNWQRSLPVVLVMALVGGFFVFRSFAGVSAPNLQYSAYQKCSGLTNRIPDMPQKDKDCLDYSAEAGIFRAYKVLLGRTPSAEDYKIFVQPMVGGDAKAENIPGRLGYDVVLKRLLATSEAKSAKGVMVSSPNDGQVVINVYKNGLGRVASDKEIYYWVQQKAANKWSTERMVLNLITAKEFRDKQRQAFSDALRANPTKVEKVKITDYARRRQTNRANLANKTNKNNTTTLNNTKERNADNRKRLAASQAIAAQAGKDISKGEYESIKKNNASVIQARVNGFKGSEYMGRVKARLAQIKKVNDITNQVKRQSPDLVTNDQVQREYNYAAYVRDQMNNEINHANWLFNESIRAYNSAKAKYDAHQAWLWQQAQINNCKSQGGSWVNNACKMPAPEPTNPGGGSGGGGSGGGSGGGGSGGGGSGGGSDNPADSPRTLWKSFVRFDCPTSFTKSTRKIQGVNAGACRAPAGNLLGGARLTCPSSYSSATIEGVYKACRRVVTPGRY